MASAKFNRRYSDELINDFYQSTACHICKSTASSRKTCGGCKLFAYCSREHQKSHWKYHKTFCKMIQGLLATNGKNRCHVFDIKNMESVTQSEWKFIKSGMKMIWEDKLGRRLTNLENQVWMFPRVCQVCLSCNQKQLIDCDNCKSVSYCGIEHRQSDSELHRAHCFEMKLCLEINCYLYQGGKYPEIKIRKNCTGEFPNNIDTFLDNCVDIESIEFGDILASDVLSPFATLLFGLQKTLLLTNRSLNKSELVIHVIGAASYEGNLPWNILFGLLFVRIKNLERLHITLVGPELESDYRHNEPFTADDKTNICWERKCYHDFRKAEEFRLPDLIAGFNCGLHEYQYGEMDSWKPSLCILTSLNSPLLLTAYTEKESKMDLQRLLVANKNLQILMDCQKNVFSSRRPLRDWENRYAPVFYQNNYMLIVNKCETNEFVNSKVLAQSISRNEHSCM